MHDISHLRRARSVSLDAASGILNCILIVALVYMVIAWALGIL